MWYFLSALMFQIFICSRKHQLDPIELVDFAGSRIKVDCYDIGSRISSSELFDDTFSYHVVGRQANGCVQTIFAAPPWISSSISPVKNHPSPVWFPMETISDAISASFFDLGRSFKMRAFFKCFACRCTEPFKSTNTKISEYSLGFFSCQGGIP